MFMRGPAEPKFDK